MVEKRDAYGDMWLRKGIMCGIVAENRDAMGYVVEKMDATEV